MAEVTVHWKLTRPDEPVSYGSITAPRSDKQAIPAGARVIPEDTWLAETAEQARRAEAERDRIEHDALAAAAQARADHDKAMEELAALGISPETVAILLRRTGA
jgi:hypothetical protein